MGVPLSKFELNEPAVWERRELGLMQEIQTKNRNEKRITQSRQEYDALIGQVRPAAPFGGSSQSPDTVSAHCVPTLGLGQDLPDNEAPETGRHRIVRRRRFPSN